MIFRLLTRSLFIRRKQVTLALLAVIMGASVASALVTVLLDTNKQLAKQLRQYGANIMVTPNSTGTRLEVSGISLSDLDGGAVISEKGLYKIKTIFWKYQITGFAPLLSGVVGVGNGPAKAVLTGTWFSKSVDVPGESFSPFITGIDKISPWWKIEGRWIKSRGAGAGSEALVGAGIARRLGLRPGDAFPVRYQGRAVTLQVQGIVTTGGPEDNQIFADLRVAQDLFGLPGKVGRVQVSALITPENAFSRRDPKTMNPKEYERWYCTPYISAISYQIAEALPGTTAKPIGQIADAENNFLNKIQLMMFLITAIVIAASSFGVMTAMTTGVFERRKEIGIMKAIGADPSQVARVFLAEAVLLGLLGGTVGYAVGLSLAKLIGWKVFETAVKVPVSVLPITLTLALCIALAGSILPVRSATRVDTIAALQS